MKNNQEVLSEELPTEKEGYKKTKLGWIPEEWSTPKIEDAFQFLKTNSYSRKQLNYDRGDVFYIHYGDIHATYKKTILDFEKEELVPRINKEVKLPTNVDFLKDGDVVIADASEDYEGVGEAIEMKNLNGRKVISGLHTFALRDIDKKTVEGFRAYIFKSYKVKKTLKTIATGSKVYGISKSNVQKFKIILPPLPEQRKIAEILSTWDKAIALLEQLITQKQALKKGLMQELLTGKKRFPGFSGDWEEVRIDKVFKMVAGKDIQKSSFNQSNIKDFIYPVYSNALTNKGLYGYYNYYQFEPNKITITARGGLGMAVPRYENFNAIGRLLVLSPLIELSIKFVAEYINNVLNIFVESTGVPQLTAPQFSNYKVKLPRKEEQEKIATVLSNFDTELEHLKNYKNALIEQKRGLMQQLLTGKKRVEV